MGEPTHVTIIVIDSDSSPVFRFMPVAPDDPEAWSVGRQGNHVRIKLTTYARTNPQIAGIYQHRATNSYIEIWQTKAGT
ncbi:MAG: hypothetical protein H6641_16085 [Caldilineaceae bacterium]|nr:hypothetical protein [Caldilineaceae bacterium]